MKKIIFYLCIVSSFAVGFRGGCLIHFVNFAIHNPLGIDDGFLYLNSDAGMNENYYIASGEGGKIWRTTDPVNIPWDERVSNTTNDLTYVNDSKRSDTSVTYIVGRSGTIVRSLDQGMTWTLHPSGVNNDLNGIDFIGSGIDQIIAVGDSGLVLRSSDGGETWSPVNSGVIKNLNSVYSLSSFITIIAGDEGTVLKSSDSGLNWVNQSLPDTTSDLNKISSMGSWFFGPILGMVGDNGKLYSSTNYNFWNPVETGTNENLYDLQFKNASSGYVTGENGTIQYTIDGGNKWFSEIFLSTITSERIRASIMLNDTTAVGVAGSDIITIHANETLLPVELASFNFNVQNNNVNLYWSTLSEINNSGFEVERKLYDGQHQQNWVRISFVEGNGSVNSTSNYEYTDKGLNAGKYNYRLKQIDFNGNFEYHDLSGEAVIGIPDKFELSQNYPNPFNPKTVIRYEIRVTGIAKLKVFDVLGNEIAELVNEKQNAGSYSVEFDGNGFASGVYFYRLESDNFIDIKRMMLIK